MFKAMVASGTPPGDIALYFGITTSNVHYHKKKLKDEGVQFPNVQGQRPTRGTYKILPNGKIIVVDIPVEDIVALPKELTSVSQDQDSTANETNQMANDFEEDRLKIYVNGTLFTVSAKAKRININGKDSIDVEF
jgi:hypothetical protein